ncbi:disease resistance RGA2-like [Chlorella sorokiniana]|uniref:Disease resistance RGA2-like n=1 Tax=Chlorella sorokiniana TaxID=3076 RepID=A0A2P6TN51_CHLSO|nr:disease resistance RGA2-like [Chlorella sorokiniana]|eukprot:PRW50765.1 disease resistance RGA2-like [Chlorella sorokiniana]
MCLGAYCDVHGAEHTVHGISGCAAEAPPPASFSTLPDELVAAILSHMAADERHCGPALVCRQWSRLCYSPELLAELDTGESETSCGVDTVIARLDWPAGRSALTSLELSLSDPDGLAQHYWLPFTTRSQLAVATPTAGAPHDSCLRLQRLTLRAAAIIDLRATVLPASLTHLTWSERCDDLEDLPAEVAALTSLRSLGLEDCGYTPERVAALAPSLQHLRLEVTPAPIALDQLTGLQALHLRPAAFPEPMHAITNALPCLSRLTGLALVGISLLPWGQASLLECLPHLTALERLAICDRDTAGEAPCLPAGAWAARLRWLAADWQLLLRSPGLLGDADQLERLAIMGGRVCHGSGKRLWDTVAAHPCLCRLDLHPTFSCGETFQPEPQLAALVRRPAAAIAARRPWGLTFAAVEDAGPLWAGMLAEWD